MDTRAKAIIIGLVFAIVLIIHPFVSAQQAAEDKNKNLTKNKSSENRDYMRTILNLKNHTVTVIDTRTNETISVKNFTPKTNTNATQSETLKTNAENTTTSGILVPGKTTINDNHTANMQNTTTANTQNTRTSLNLTDNLNP